MCVSAWGEIPQAHHTCIPEATDDGNSQRHICHLLSGVSVRAGKHNHKKKKIVEMLVKTKEKRLKNVKRTVTDGSDGGGVS